MPRNAYPRWSDIESRRSARHGMNRSSGWSCDDRRPDFSHILCRPHARRELMLLWLATAEGQVQAQEASGQALGQETVGHVGGQGGGMVSRRTLSSAGPSPAKTLGHAHGHFHTRALPGVCACREYVDFCLSSCGGVFARVWAFHSRRIWGRFLILRRRLLELLADILGAHVRSRLLSLFLAFYPLHGRTGEAMHQGRPVVPCSPERPNRKRAGRGVVVRRRKASTWGPSRTRTAISAARWRARWPEIGGQMGHSQSISCALCRVMILPLS